MSTDPKKPSRLISVAIAIVLANAAGVRPAQAQSAENDDSTQTVTITATGSQVELPDDYAGGQVARGGRIGLFGNLDLMDTPFNSTNYTADFMRNLQARSVADVVQSDPSVRVARGFGNFQELYVVRGFPVYSDDMAYNGLYGLLPRQYVAAEFLERVEVFRGANSFLNGAAPSGSAVGGFINLVPKRAPDRPLTRMTVGYESDSHSYLAADVARRFGSDDRFGVRVNGVRRDGNDAIDNEERRLDVASLGFDLRGERARFSADIGWQDQRIDSPRPSVTPFGGIPSAPEADSNFAQRWTFSGERDLFGVARGELDLTEKTKVWAATGVRESEEHNVLANPTSTATGASTTYRFDNYREDLVTTSEVGLRTELATGAVGHRVSASGSIFKLDSKNAYGFSRFGGIATDLYSPIDVAPPVADFFTGGVLFDPLTTSESKTSSIALADTLSFSDDRVLATLGARYQTLEQYSYDYDTGALLTDSAYDESVVTPVFGLVVKPSDRYSVYANYIESLLPGGVVPLLIDRGGTQIRPANAGESLDPFQSEQVEVGAKYDRGNLGVTLALFRITKPNSIFNGVAVGTDGEQLNQGFEVSWFGQPLDGFRVLGGVTLLNAEQKKTQDGVNDGNDVIGVPDTQANLGVEWDAPAVQGLTLDSRLIYTSEQAADAANTLSIPSWTRLDVGARYVTAWAERDVTLRARVDNVTDRNYWASVGGASDANYLVLGQPRTFTLSASVDF
jgi:iron complex outermembrane recepter protein